MSEMADTLGKTERKLRDRFVEEYLVDYDAFGAAIRIGYSEAFARQYSQQFMLEPYVRKRITSREQELGITTEEDQHRRKIVSGLYRIAHSPNSAASAQVAAYTQLAKIVGIEAPVKTQQEVTVTSTSPEMDHLTLEDLEAIKKKLYVKTSQ